MKRFFLTVFLLAAACLPPAARAAEEPVPEATAHYLAVLPADEKEAGLFLSARVRFPSPGRAVDEVVSGGVPVRFSSPVPPAEDGGAVAAVFAEEAQVNGAVEFVYDGVVFDEFPRDGRTDWGMGTACRNEVVARLELVNPFPFTLPAGEWTVFRRPGRAAPFLLPTASAGELRARQRLSLLLGAVPGLSGTRERRSVSELVPGSVLEERFTVTLRNSRETPCTVKVVEHFYRGGLPRLAEADAPHELAGPGAISFRLSVPARGRKVLNYTVQYTW